MFAIYTVLREFIHIHKCRQPTSRDFQETTYQAQYKALFEVGKIRIEDDDFICFETRDSIAYWEEFDKPKLVWTPVNSEYRFTILPPSIYFNNSLFMISGANLEFMCAVFNSKLFIFYFNMMLSNGQYAYGAGETFSNFKLKRISIDDNHRITALVNKLLNSPVPNDVLHSEIDKLVYNLYNLSLDEINYIECM